MKAVTKKQRANLLDALNVMWPSVPPKNVIKGLELWRADLDKPKNSPPTCRTVACFGGWCAWWPAFRQQGVRVGDYGAPEIRGGWARLTALQLFGDDNLFNTRGEHDADCDFEGTDHELVTNRLKWLLAKSKVV